MGGLFQINPIWLFGPYKAAVVSAASQPDWYVMFLDGSTRLFPPWEIRSLRLGHGPSRRCSGRRWCCPASCTMLPMLYPFIEARFSKDTAGAPPAAAAARRAGPHRRWARWRSRSTWCCCISGGNDVIADKFDISLNAMTWAGRIGIMLVLPPLAYYVAYRICLGLQQHDREVLAHGVETGIIRRLPDGRFVEIHQPLGRRPTTHGHAALEYAGAPVPKKMNRLGALAPAVKGFFFPIEKPAPPPLPPASVAGVPRRLAPAVRGRRYPEAQLTRPTARSNR